MEQEAIEAPVPVAVEQKITILIEGNKIEFPARLIPLVGTFKNLFDDLKDENARAQDIAAIPVEDVSLATWQHIERHLERLFQMNQSDQQAEEAMSLDYKGLEGAQIVDLLNALDKLDIYLPEKITTELVQSKLCTQDILALCPDRRNEVIKLRTQMIAGTELPKKLAVWSQSPGPYACLINTTHDGKIITYCFNTKSIQIWDLDGHRLAV
jgi:hypothetical protein